MASPRKRGFVVLGVTVALVVGLVQIVYALDGAQGPPVAGGQSAVMSAGAPKFIIVNRRSTPAKMNSTSYVTLKSVNVPFSGVEQALLVVRFAGESACYGNN